MAWPITDRKEQPERGDEDMKQRAESRDSLLNAIAPGPKIAGREPGEIDQIFSSLEEAISMLEMTQESLIDRIQPIVVPQEQDKPMPATVPTQRDPASPMGKALEDQVQRINRLRLRQEDARERISL